MKFELDLLVNLLVIATESSFAMDYKLEIDYNIVGIVLGKNGKNIRAFASKYPKCSIWIKSSGKRSFLYIKSPISSNVEVEAKKMLDSKYRYWLNKMDSKFRNNIIGIINRRLGVR